MLSEPNVLAFTIVAAVGVWAFRQWRARLGPLRASAEEEWIAKSFVPNAAMGRAYIFREESVPFIGIDLCINGEVVGETYGKTFLQIDLPPGEHILTGKDRMNGLRSDLLLRVDAGRLYFVRQVVWRLDRKWSHGFIALCEPMKAQSVVRRCRMMTTN